MNLASDPVAWALFVLLVLAGSGFVYVKVASRICVKRDLATEHEPPPVHNDFPVVWDLVILDMKARNEAGTAKYGTPLQPFNGRDPLVDAYQEALDLAVYLRQAIFERDRK